MPEGGWAVARSIRGLIEAGVPRRIDPGGLRSYLRMGAVYEPLTILKGARAVLPATWEDLDLNGAVTSTRWWSLQPIASLGGMSVTSAVDRLHEAVVGSVSSSLQAEGPLGVLASGGSDSTGILLTLEDLDAPPSHTISLGFGGPDADASEHLQQRECAKRFGTPHHEWLATSESVEPLLPGFFDAMDQPTIDGLNSYLAGRIAADCGVKTLLSGFGGDEVFAGYGSFRSLRFALADASMMRRFPRSMRRAFAAVASRRGDDRRPEWAKLASWIEDAPLINEYYVLRRSLFLPHQVDRLMGVSSSLEDEVLTRRSDARGDVLARWSALELENHLPNTLLRASDRFSHAYDVELRFPYLDHRVVELALGIPDTAKYERGHRKPLMRDVFGGRLPDFVWSDSKRHFQVPIDRWLARPEFEFEQLACLDSMEVDRVVAAYRRHPDLRTSSRAWALYVLGQSLRRLFGPS